MIEKPLLPVTDILKMEEKGFQIVLKRGRSPIKTKYYPYYTDEWGVSPSDTLIEKEKTPFYRIEYMKYDQLIDRLEIYKKENKLDRYQETPVTSNERKAQVADILYQKTKDQQLYNMIMNDEYMNATQLVQERYRNIISKLEMTRLLESIVK